MSDKVYFGDHDTHNFRWYLTRGVSGFFAYCLPWLTSRFARKHLVKPGRRPQKFNSPEGLVEIDIPTRFGRVHCYQLGAGPVVLMMHGWSGASEQYFRLMEYVASQGYTALAFDQIAHGKSEGQTTNLPTFVRSLEDILDHLNKVDQKPVMIIAHSMAGITAANLFHGEEPILMIAPAFGFKQQMMDRIHSAGIHPVIMQRLIQDLEAEFDLKIDKLEPDQHLGKFGSKLIIVHDVEDRFNLHDGSRLAVAKYPDVELITTQGMGHSRIINSNEVKEAIRKLLDLL